MNCQDAWLLILERSVSAKTGSEGYELEEHLETCSACRKLAMAHGAVLSDHSGLRRCEADPVFYQKVDLKLKSTVRVHSGILLPLRDYRAIGSALAGLAAAVILGIWIGGLLTGGNAIPGNSATTAVSTNQGSEITEDYTLARLENYFFDEN
ncbi:MAG TPA: hypothetical protein PLV51_08180, partial [Lentimicrobium sp.]|nr:hypothetical protein [Lentimicrobium sp.]